MPLFCLFNIVPLLLISSGVIATTLLIRNECNYTVWPAIASPPSTTTGFSLQISESRTIDAPTSWNGRIWGRTYCTSTQNSTTNFSCITGDCGSGKLDCSSSSSAASPVTLAEFKLGNSDGVDFYNVSLLDGYNLPMLVVPSDQNCKRAGCFSDLNGVCPIELMKVTRGDGKTIGCNSACNAFRTSQYCCDGTYGTPETCKPTSYSRIFKNACPDTRVYAGNDDNTTFTCASADYLIIFCGFLNDSVAFKSSSGTLTANSTNNPGPSSGGTTPGPSPKEIAPSPLPELRSNSTNVTVISGNNPGPSSGGITPGPSPIEIAPSPPPKEIAPSPSPETPPKTTQRKLSALIVAVIIGGGLLIISLLILIFGVRWWRKSRKTEDVEDDLINQVPGMPLRFSYENLCAATNDFKERLGRGGFGSVFRGVLADGTEIAVKHLEILGPGKSAFLAEVETIGSLHHFNLVRLIGFCAEKSHRLLVYEYMSNGSLDKWIFKKEKGSYLDWDTRKKIMLDIAKGLAYLHEDCRQTIMHLDIKPQNILLDPNFNAKISDFGLSKLVDRDMSQVEISMRGTPGYLAPEWRQSLGRITVKVDTYSFGIVLLEVVCTRRNADRSQPESAFLLLGMLQKKAEQDRLMDIVENLDEYNNQSQREEIIRMIKIGAWCLQDDPERRPLMSTVVKVLEGVMEVESNLIYKFSHALISSPVVHNQISSAPQPASVLSNPR